MEVLNPTRNPNLNLPGIPDVDPATIALTTVAEALSKAAQAIAEASLAVAEAITLLDNSGNNYSANPLAEDNHALGGQEFTQDDADFPPRNSPKIQNPLNSNQEMDRLSPTPPPQETNNKGNPTVPPSPKSDFPDTTPATSGVAPQTSAPPSTATASEVQASEAPVQPTPSTIPPMQPNDAPNTETEPLDLRSMVTTYPMFPAGRNYIQLDRYMDETSVAAYLALQSNKTICIIHKRAGVQWSYCAKIFNAITKFSVYHHADTGGFATFERALHSFKTATSPAILLVPNDGVHRLMLSSANPDTIVHWGVPLDMPNYVWQMSSFQQPVRSCVLLQWQPNLEALRMSQWSLFNNGFVQYPDFLLHTCFGPTSPYHMVRKVSAQVLNAMNTPTPGPSKVGENPSGTTRSTTPGPITPGPIAPQPIAPQPITTQPITTQPITSQPITSQPITPQPIMPQPITPQPITPQPITPQPQTSCPLPQGHYYMVLKEPLDAVPLIAYLTAHHRKALCYLPVDANSGAAYQQLFKRITNIPTTYCADPNKLRLAMSSFGETQSATIFLRLANDKWESCLRKRYTDCLIYWGLPERIDHYISQCRLKVAHSYMIITPSQYDQFAVQLAGQASAKLRAHPSSDQLNDGRRDSVLHDMRQKTEKALSTISNPPISSSEYKALMKRRNP